MLRYMDHAKGSYVQVHGSYIQVNGSCIQAGIRILHSYTRTMHPCTRIMHSCTGIMHPCTRIMHSCIRIMHPCTVAPRCNVVVGVHEMEPHYKRGALYIIFHQKPPQQQPKPMYWLHGLYMIYKTISHRQPT